MTPLRSSIHKSFSASPPSSSGSKQFVKHIRPLWEIMAVTGQQHVSQVYSWDGPGPGGLTIWRIQFTLLIGMCTFASKTRLPIIAETVINQWVRRYLHGPDRIGYNI